MPLQRISAAINALDTPELRNALTDYRDLMERSEISLRTYQQAQKVLLTHVERAISELPVQNHISVPSERLQGLLQSRNIALFFENLYREISQLIMPVSNEYPLNSHSYVEQAQQYITEHLAQPISLDQIADTLRISGGHLSRLFNEYLGESFIDYVTRVRMERMCELLLKSDESIQQIARDVGLINVSYCIRRFKQTYGMTPGQYRQINRTGSSSSSDAHQRS